MSIELDIVCARQVDIRASARMAGMVLDLTLGPTAIVCDDHPRNPSFFRGDARVGAYQADLEHEYGDADLWTIACESREPCTYILCLVLASTASFLFDGRIVDHVGFFPTVAPDQLVRHLLSAGAETCDGLWERLRERGELEQRR